MPRSFRRLTIVVPALLLLFAPRTARSFSSPSASRNFFAESQLRQGPFRARYDRAPDALFLLSSHRRRDHNLLPSLSMTGADSNGEEEGSGRSSLLVAIDDAGLSLKPRAEKAIAKLALAESRGRKLKYLLQTCLLYAAFILYRAYRGLFVILPAVFRSVYERLERAVEAAPFDDGSSSTASKTTASGAAAVVDDDINPATGKVRWRTRITVSVLASIVTASYVVGGAARVAARFVSSLAQTSSVPESFQAAAREQEGNEGKILRRLAISVADGSGGSSRVNGTTQNGDSDKPDISSSNDDEATSGGRYSDLAP